MVQTHKDRNGLGQPKTDWAKDINRLRYDRDIVEKYGLKAARFVTYLECWLRGKVTRTPGKFQFTYDPAWLICERTGLKPATLERIVKRLRADKFIKVKPGAKNTRHYALFDQNNYYDDREKEKHMFALRADAVQHGDPAAILLNNLRHWHKFNKAERDRLFQGRYWRYDTIKDLVWLFTGFLTKEQLRDALRDLSDKKLVNMIAFLDANGVRQEGKFWITLMEIPPVEDYEPLNRVRPASLFTRDGQLIEAEKAGENGSKNDDKTGSQNDKTPSPNDKTESGQKARETIVTTGDNVDFDFPLIDNPYVTPGVADAPTGSTQVRVGANLRLPEQPARPSASQKPSASSAACLAPGNNVCPTYRSGELVSMKAELEKLSRQVQNLTLNLELKKAPGMNKDGWLESMTDLILKIPRSVRRNFQYQFSKDKDNAVKPKEDGKSLVGRLQLEEEMRQVNSKKIPRECFGQQFGDPRLTCKSSCLWAASCKIATPVEIREAIQLVNQLNSPDWNVLRESDRTENVAETYRVCYREVFGTEAPDTVGKAVAIYQNVQSLKVPVRLYCLIYMAQWANTHPYQKFYARFLSGENACELVRMVLDLCDQKYGTILEDRLAMVLHLKFTADKKPLWRHQPTPAERFMAGWLKACTDVGIKDYQFQAPEVQELGGFTDDFRLKDAEKMLDDAKVWLVDTTGEKTLMRFLCEDQGKQVPEPEVALVEDAKQPYYEHLIDESEGDYDITRTRAYWEDIERNKEIARRSRPASGPKFVEQMVADIEDFKVPKRRQRTNAENNVGS